jgi:2-aminobenzoate-CoA ligase
MSDVAECAVIGVADEARGQIVQAHVVLNSGVAADEVTTKRLQDHVKAVIALQVSPVGDTDT